MPPLAFSPAGPLYPVVGVINCIYSVLLLITTIVQSLQLICYLLDSLSNLRYLDLTAHPVGTASRALISKLWL